MQEGGGSGLRAWVSAMASVLGSGRGSGGLSSQLKCKSKRRRRRRSKRKGKDLVARRPLHPPPPASPPPVSPPPASPPRPLLGSPGLSVVSSFTLGCWRDSRSVQGAREFRSRGNVWGLLVPRGDSEQPRGDMFEGPGRSGARAARSSRWTPRVSGPRSPHWPAGRALPSALRRPPRLPVPEELPKTGERALAPATPIQTVPEEGVGEALRSPPQIGWQFLLNVVSVDL